MSKTINGYAGRLLRVDLTFERLSDVTFDEQTLRKYVGGTGLGAKILYDGSEPIEPTFGPTDEVPPLNTANVDAVGVPMNLQPPTVFNTPVRIFIPCPGYTDVSQLSVFLYNGTGWVLACNAAGIVQPGAVGWMVPSSRVAYRSKTSAPKTFSNCCRWLG